MLTLERIIKKKLNGANIYIYLAVYHPELLAYLANALAKLSLIVRRTNSSLRTSVASLL